MPTPGETFLRALDELVDSQQRGDSLGVRQAAEKTWLAVVEATDLYLARMHNIVVPMDRTAHVERRRFLRDTGRGDLAIRYGHFSETLHGEIFYFGELVSSATLRTLLEDAADYVEQTTSAGGLVDAVLRKLA